MVAQHVNPSARKPVKLRANVLYAQLGPLPITGAVDQIAQVNGQREGEGVERVNALPELLDLRCGGVTLAVFGCAVVQVREYAEGKRSAGF